MYSVKIYPYTLQFKKPATTSRGALLERAVYYIGISNGQYTSWGEAGTLPGLSIDDVPEYTQKVLQLTEQIEPLSTWLNSKTPFDYAIEALNLEHFPSISFAVESALTGLQQGVPYRLFDTGFFEGKQSISINGLVWMDNSESMLKQAEEKIAQGYTCVKLKIGALDFDEECRLLEAIRKKLPASKLELRVDANGAFAPDTALEQLRELNRFDLHSIEQPVKANQWDLMEELCAKSKLAIALDEELIGVLPSGPGERMLRKIKPAYIILKPSLLGGFTRCNQWLQAAQQNQIGYWITSALESNIGLSAIAQYTSTLPVSIPQGLGTGQLYTNNIPSPLEIRDGYLHYASGSLWDMTSVTNVCS
jgi:o-succinylbenzoate synthase